MEIETKVMILLSKRFLVVAALAILIIGSSIAVIPVRAPSGSKIVYVAICVDTENLYGISPWFGSSDPHPTLDVREYSRTVPSTVAAVFDSNFRNSNRDSFGNIFKMSWFAEMDYFYAQSNFVWADGSPAGVSGYTATYDLLENNWGIEIQTYGDSIEYHHHFMIYDGTWQRYDNGPDAWYPEYQMYALDYMIIDRNFYPSTWRSGMWVMPPALSSWLEQWMPFDYTPTTGIYYPVHPSGMSRWQTKCPYAPDVQKEVNSAFAYARDHGSAVFSICTHDKENMKSQVSWLQYCLNTADANEATYPNVSFKYVSAREAMQLALGITDFTPPTFTVTSSGNTYTIVSSEPLWKNHPYIALKYTDETYLHMSATPTGTNTWIATPPTQLTSEENVARASGVTASASSYDGSHTPELAIDGVESTSNYWGTNSANGLPQWLQLDLGSPVAMSKILTHFYDGDTRTYTYHIDASLDGSSWTTIVPSKSASGRVTDTFTEGTYRYVKITVTGCWSNSAQIEEIKIYHVTSTQLPPLEIIGVAGSDLYGNPGTTTFTQDQYALTVGTVGSGSVTKSPDQATYASGTVVTLTAVPSAGWSFNGWSGDLVGSDNPATITMNSDKTVTATFSQNEYTLTIDVVGQGSVSKEPDQATYIHGTPVQLTATPQIGWSFSYWGGDLSGSNNPATITITGDRSVTATFTQDQYTLTANVVGGGSVTKDPDQATYAYGTSVQLTAIPALGWSFSTWSGDLGGNTNPATIVMDGDKIVTATFIENQYTLTVNTVGSGSVSKIPDQATYVYGTSVELTGISDLGWSFSQWTGDLTGSVNPATIMITGNMAITASFTEDQYTLSITIIGDGTVTKSQDLPTYSYGSVVTLTATPSIGWSFGGWSGDLIGSENPTTITMTTDKSAIALFTQNQCTLTINIVGQGSVGKEPDQATYTYGTDVQLTATATVGWTFTGWSGDLSGTDNPVSLTVTDNRVITATFTQDQYTLTINTVGSGSVNKNPEQITYTYGTPVELTAVPALGWSFTGWSGDLSGNTNPDTITMDASKTVTATFTENLYTLSVTTAGQGVVAVSPSGPYMYGVEVQLTATAEAGWSFAGWSGDLSGTQSPVDLVMDDNKIVTATFIQNEYILDVSIVGSGSVTKAPDKSTYHYNDVVELTAVPNSGWSFSGWSGSLVGNPTLVTITGDLTVTATFTQIEYSLTVYASPTEGGSVTKSPDYPHYHYNDVVELTATASADWSFIGWSGGLTSNPTSVTITSDMIITATFAQSEYSLTINIVGSGSVIKVPDQLSYHLNDVVQLAATPDVGWSFSGWSGDLTGSTNPASITINGDMAVTATFTQNTYSITASVIGVGGTIDPAGVVLVVAGGSQSFTIEADPGYVIADVVVDDVSQGAVSEYTFDSVTMDHSIVASFRQGTYIITASVDGVGGTIDPSGAVSVNGGETITFTITPENGYHVLNVMVDGTYMGPQNSFTFYEVDRDHTITAIFAKNEYSLTIIIVGAGSVRIIPNKISYSYGDIVELTAIPNNKNFQFAYWSGDLTGSTNPATIIMDGSKTVTATFAKKAKLPASSQKAISWSSILPQEYSLMVSTVGSGSVVKVPNQASYHLSDVVTLTATLTAGWSFSAWSGDISSSLNPISIIIHGTTFVTATFTQNMYTLIIRTLAAAPSP